MYTENDLSSNGYVHGTESSQSKLNRQLSVKNLDNPDVKMSLNGKGSDLMRESEMGHDGFRLKSSKFGNLGSHQELTLSYLCDNNNNSKMMMGFQEKEISGKNFLSSLEKGGSSSRYKGKEVVSDSINEENERLVERDFLQLNGISGGGGGGSKRENDEGEEDREKRDKKPKLESQTLNLSLSLPDVSLSLTSSNPLPRADHPLPSLKPSRSTQSFMPSNNNTRTGSSDDYTAASLSYSYSHQFSHNPSCSLTHNSTENFEYSVGSRRREDQIWYGGEGTNGSVHSRFKPVGDGVSLSNNGGFGNSLMQANQPNEKECSNSMYRTGSENQSFFPSELPARPWRDTQSGDSRGRASDQQRGFENSEGGRPRKLTRPERILREIVSESITVMAQILQELPDETIETTKDHLKNLIGLPEKREELAALQNRLERRSDLTFELLSKSHRAQLDILVAVKTGLSNYLAEKNRLPTPELIEIFLLTRCRNVNCKSVLPIDDCDCKICSTKKGFCSACMCPVCSNFDCANNTCSWVGCDVCSHWCHAVCGIQKNLIKPGPSLRGPAATTEMQFHCIGCGHASEMYGFVKEVFMCCAKDWGLETLIKELDCVRKIFRGSDDSKGKDLWNKSEEMLSKLENKLISPSDACSLILQFFKYGKSEFSGSGSSSKDLTSTVTAAAAAAAASASASAASVQISQQRGADVVSLPPSISLPPKSIPYNINSSSSVRRDFLKDNARQTVLKSPMNDTITPEEDLHSNILSKDGFESLESIVRIKEAEARMFQTRADDARREAEGYRRMARARSEKLEEEYTSKLAKLCLQDTEDRRRKKLEEVKALENSHCDYYNMKIRMQAEITGLLERMEATKQQWV